MTSHACIFCDHEAPSLFLLVQHLIGVHSQANWANVKRAGHFLYFKVYSTHKDRKVRCICGQRFTCNVFASPAFFVWALANLAENDSFTAHLRREGGLKAHLDNVCGLALLDRVAGKKVDSRYEKRPRT